MSFAVRYHLPQHAWILRQIIQDGYLMICQCADPENHPRLAFWTDDGCPDGLERLVLEPEDDPMPDVPSAEPMFRRGVLSLPAAARVAQVLARRFQRLARLGRLPFRVRRAPGWWEVDEGSFRDWLTSQRGGDRPA